jgi:hypothetical protein
MRQADGLRTLIVLPSGFALLTRILRLPERSVSPMGALHLASSDEVRQPDVHLPQWGEAWPPARISAAMCRARAGEMRTVMRACCAALVIAWMLFVVIPLPVAAQPIEVKRISFAPGSSSATLKGSITGDKTVDYKLGAKAGQTMSVKLKTGNLSNYFNVLPPGSETALFVGSTSGNEWTGSLPTDGDYTIRVYLMRNAARRNERANYALTVGITGRTDAKVAGTPDHATGTVPCSLGTDSKGSAQCSFGVIRSAPGHAEVHLASPMYVDLLINPTTTV